MYFGFQNISISYGKKNILKDVSLMFAKGKITTIIGKNGCGKSSLLKTFSKAVKPNSGFVVFEDKPISGYKPKHLAQRIAYVPQKHFSPPDIDVRTLVSYGRYPHIKFGKGLTKTDSDIIDRTIEFTGLSQLKYQSVSTLSGGECQRAWIAMAVCQQPEILILDEPTTFLDISYQLEVLELIKELNTKLGLTIIMVLHDLNMAARFSDYLYAIKDCSLCSEGCPRDIITKEGLESIFHIDAEIFEDCKNDCPYFIPLNIKTKLKQKEAL